MTLCASDVINFWFDDTNCALWFKKSDEFDELIRQKFTALHRKASACELHPWRQHALGALAEIIVLDQFSRNIFRHHANAFAQDGLALALAQNAIASGLDTKLNCAQRSFIYLPFMHSESLAIHDLAIELFSSLDSPTHLKFAMQHRDIIAKFGRYPHRNAILKRKSTTEELVFLTTKDSSF